jgi:hypothetical protein
MPDRRFEIGVSAIALALCGCGGPPTSDVLLFGSLGNAIRATGFVCENVVRAEEIESTGSDWRVVCDEALVYLASMGTDGAVCIEPVFQGDADERAAVGTPEPRCTDPESP